MQSDCLWSTVSFPLKEERASSDNRRHILETDTKLGNFLQRADFFPASQNLKKRIIPHLADNFASPMVNNTEQKSLQFFFPQIMLLV